MRWSQRRTRSPSLIEAGIAGSIGTVGDASTMRSWSPRSGCQARADRSRGGIKPSPAGRGGLNPEPLANPGRFTLATDLTWPDCAAYLGIPFTDDFREQRHDTTQQWALLWSPAVMDLLRDGLPSSALADVGRLLLPSRSGATTAGLAP
jgi:hypothetical protein